MDTIILEQETYPSKHIKKIILSEHSYVFFECLNEINTYKYALKDKELISQSKNYNSGSLIKSYFKTIKESILDQNKNGFPFIIWKYIQSILQELVSKFKKISSKHNLSYDTMIHQFKYHCNLLRTNYEENIDNQASLKRNLFTNRQSNLHNLNKKDANINNLKRTLTSNFIKNEHLTPNHLGEYLLSNHGGLISNKDTDFEKKYYENNKKKLLKMLENQVKKNNKINIYVTDYETLVNRQNEPCELYKIYDGGLIEMKYLKYNPNLLNHERKKLDVNVNDLLLKNKDKSIFVPNNDNLKKQKRIIRSRAKKEGIFYEKDNYDSKTNQAKKSNLIKLNLLTADNKVNKHNKKIKFKYNDLNNPSINVKNLKNNGCVDSLKKSKEKIIKELDGIKKSKSRNKKEQIRAKTSKRVLYKLLTKENNNNIANNANNSINSDKENTNLINAIKTPKMSILKKNEDYKICLNIIKKNFRKRENNKKEDNLKLVTESYNNTFTTTMDTNNFLTLN